MRTYGALPEDLGHIHLELSEVFYYLYLPISMPNSSAYTLPHSLKPFVPLINRVRMNEPLRFFREYVYFTGKRMYVGPGISPNRGGWHSDGFLTDDLNFIWSDCLPTIFNTTEFNVPPDDEESLELFERQAEKINDLSYPNEHMLKLDQFVIHKVGVPEKMMMRTFVKISISPDIYNLAGNSHNYDLNYKWNMVERSDYRNQPASK